VFKKYLNVKHTPENKSNILSDKMDKDWSDCVLFSDNKGHSSADYASQNSIELTSSKCGHWSNKHSNNIESDNNVLRPFSELRNSIDTHCLNLRIKVPLLTEAALIQNRIGREFKYEQKICPKHRYENGIYWKPVKGCVHPTHSNPSKIRKKTTSIRFANFEMSAQIKRKHGVAFPMGSPICSNCRLKTCKDEEQMNVDNDIESDDEDFIPNQIKNAEMLQKLNSVINILPTMQKKCKPIQHQIIKNVNNLSESMVRNLKFTCNQYIAAFVDDLTETLCPGQGPVLQSLLNPVVPVVNENLTETITNEIVEAVPHMHDKSMQLMSMSFVARNQSVQKLMNTFKCSRLVAATAKQIALGNKEVLKKFSGLR
jgi:hypothetical protein